MARLVRASVGAAVAAILPLDTHKITMQDAIQAYASADINGSAQVDGTIADLGIKIPVSVGRATTVITVTFPTLNPHTLGSSADYVLISGTGNALLDGVWPLATVTNSTVITITSPSSGTIAAVNGIATPLRLYQAVIATGAMAATVKIPTVTAANAFYTLPFSALILNCTTWVAGTIYLDVRQTGIV